ncbi:MAG: UPF0158 family protein [Spirochaetales bacterium]|nr:UPF0158 family protein [Spirochaetales bacterium]
MNRKIVLSPELLEQIIYGMENQSEIFCLDVEKLIVIPRKQKEEEDPEELRYLSLPRWTPADGFNIMERFVLSLNNPLYRTRLRSILHSGKGVFRNFKDLLKEKPEVERLWFRYKTKELRLYIQEWLNGYENYRTMISLGEAREDLEELLLSDFQFLTNPEHHREEIHKLDVRVLEEREKELPLELAPGEQLYHRMEEDSEFITAESPNSELTGFIIYYMAGDGAVITNIYTLPEYRGLRVAEELYSKLEEELHKRGVTQILVESVPSQNVLNHFFTDKGFQSQLITYSKKLSPDY